MNAPAFEELAAQLRGELVLPEHPEYESARHVYNGMVDRRPVAIVRPRGTADVVQAVRYAGTHGLPVGVRGGGHSVAGHGCCDGGLLVDLSAMRGVHVDAAASTVRAEGGALLADLDAEAQVFGLAVPCGQVSATGIGGLALNGGMGMLQRRFGLTCDNLLSAEVVTAAGDVVVASEDSHQELFWALRGGGGNFGVVTSFEFRAHRVGPLMLAGLVGFPVERAPEVLGFLRDFITTAPEELSADSLFMHVPPLPVIPEEHHGQLIVSIFVRYSGDPETGEQVVQPFRDLGDPVVDFTFPMPLVAVQQLLDPLNPPGNRHYWTGEYLSGLGPGEIDALTRLGSSLPSPHSLIEIIPFNAAVTRVPPDATAFAHRDDSWLVHIMGQWHDPLDTERCVAWAKQGGAELRGLGTGDCYLNLLTDDEDVDRIGAFWNDRRLGRLAAVKAEYDPDNTFRFNHNVKPAVASGSTAGGPA